MTEMHTIEAISALFPRAPEQQNRLFTCDAEQIFLGGQLYAVSVDDFSQGEDCLNDSHLPTLGANLAVATLSDLLAAGSLPRFYLHALVEPHGSNGFGLELAKGVRDVLADAGCFLLGGDMGKSDHWRYTGVAIGESFTASGLNRILPHKEQTLWVTGCLGDGNLMALAPQENTRFELRLAEARALAGVASACIDTSGGLVESLLQLRLLNPGCSIHIDSSRLPFDARVPFIASAHGIPAAGFAFGGAGEYELLFTTDPDVTLDFATPIGTTGPCANNAVFWDTRRLPPALPDPRTFPERTAYIRQLLEVVQQCTA